MIVPTWQADDPDWRKHGEYICDQCHAPMGKSLFPSHCYRHSRKAYKFCPLCGAPAGNYLKSAKRKAAV